MASSYTDVISRPSLNSPTKEPPSPILEVFTYLMNPVERLLSSPLEAGETSIPLLDISMRDVMERIRELLPTYRLDRFGERKLPPSMAKEYPFLDMSNSE